MDKIQIEAYSLMEYTQKVAQAATDGYSVDITQNDGVPNNYSNYYTVYMYRQQEVVTRRRKTVE